MSGVEERFWAKVDKNGPVPEYAPHLGPCWPWTAGGDGNGYGYFRVGAKRVLAHRFVYELLVGPIPEGLQIDHLCRVRACCNPDHLEAVTQRENLLRGAGHPAVNAAKTHCVNGHEFTPENTYVWHGGRHCRACRRASRLRTAAKGAARE